jgi:hypothetical protein
VAIPELNRLEFFIALAFPRDLRAITKNAAFELGADQLAAA